MPHCSPPPPPPIVRTLLEGGWGLYIYVWNLFTLWFQRVCMYLSEFRSKPLLLQRCQPEPVKIWEITNSTFLTLKTIIQSRDLWLNLKNSSNFKHFFPKIPNIGQNIQYQKDAFYALFCFIQKIWWPIQESGRFCLSKGDSWIIRKSWHTCRFCWYWKCLQ